MGETAKAVPIFWPGDASFGTHRLLVRKHPVAGGRNLGVLDWEEAACGDPVIDVAYARMNMFLMGLPEAAKEFLRVYEAESGRKAENLSFWEMAAAVRPMDDRWGGRWIGSRKADLFQHFMKEARKRS